MVSGREGKCMEGKAGDVEAFYRHCPGIRPDTDTETETDTGTEAVTAPLSPPDTNTHTDNDTTYKPEPTMYLQRT